MLTLLVLILSIWEITLMEGSKHHCQSRSVFNIQHGIAIISWTPELLVCFSLIYNNSSKKLDLTWEIKKEWKQKITKIFLLQRMRFVEEQNINLMTKEHKHIKTCFSVEALRILPHLLSSDQFRKNRTESNRQYIKLSINPEIKP